MIEVNEQLAYIKHFLKKEKPSIADVVECYLTAAKKLPPTLQTG